MTNPILDAAAHALEEDETYNYIAESAGAGDFKKTARHYARVVLQAIRKLPDSLWEDGAPLDPNVLGDPHPIKCWEAIINDALKPD